MKFETPVAIYGAGGHARVVSSIVQRLGGTVFGFFDDSFHGEETIDGVPVLGKFKDILEVRENCILAGLAVGDNHARREAFYWLTQHGFRLPTLIHPNALAENDATVGDGSVVCIGAILGTKAAVGCGAIVNTGASVDHESTIGDFVHLAPNSGVAGRTMIGQGTFIGMHAAIADRLKVAEWSVIGAGSVVIRDVPANQTHAGVPARRIK